ncbi:MetQ/NlpA family ABC transporter substrate-binding protein, partial [Escherichia coli]
PNISLADGSIDLNAFQHVAYLNDWNESNKEDLQAIGFSYVAPLKLYSEKIKSLDELKEGDTVAIPSDVTNGGRALLALQQAGVIEVDKSKGVLPTVADIIKNDKNIKFQELDASQLANALPDVAAAAINNNFATDAGLSDDQAIYNDAEDIS